MSVRLTFMCATAGDTARDTVLGDGPPTEQGLREAHAVAATLPRYSRVVRAPSTRCALTAEALGLEATPEPALRDLDHGVWEGRTVGEVVADDPYGYGAWLTDPDAAPHGGESVRQLCLRVARWLSRVPPGMDHALVIADPAVIRASLVHALSAPVTAFRHFDVPPLSTLSLSRRDDRWNVRPGRLVAESAGTGRAVPLTGDVARDQSAPRRGESVSDEWYDLVARVEPSRHTARAGRANRLSVLENRAGSATTPGARALSRALAAHGQEQLAPHDHRMCARCRGRLHPRTEPGR